MRQKPTKRIRLDVLLVERDLVDSREQGQRLIMAGKVQVDGRRVTKPGVSVAPDVSLQISEPERFVSRGGYKLEAALDRFQIEPRGKVAADIGASTGGFTDCLLQHGAAKVYAIDVGYGQLHWRLRQDKRVVVMEKVNARYLAKDSLPEQVEIITIDVSFISLRLILPGARLICTPEADIVSLIKPQFEAGKEQVPRGGVIKDSGVHLQVLHKVIKRAEDEDFIVRDLIPSPLLGADGNREYLAWFNKKSNDSSAYVDIDLEKIVRMAFAIS